MHPHTSTILGAGFLAVATGPAQAAGADLLKSQCAGCHALTPPADTSLARIWERKGPDLYYAGVKFKRDWLVGWLQDPKPVRPAGYPYFKTIVAGPQHDEIDPRKLREHPRLARSEAESAADALMDLKGPEGLVEKGLFNNEAADPRMGALSFTKLRGCAGCHKGEGGEGGLSGPELTDAGARLQPDFIASFIKDPQKIDSHVWMPKLEMNAQGIQRLAAYLVQLGVEENK